MIVPPKKEIKFFGQVRDVEEDPLDQMFVIGVGIILLYLMFPKDKFVSG